MTAVLSADKLTKSFDGGFQLGPVSLELGQGSTVVILGKNGAGKSTLFQLLTGNLDATGGEVRFGGAKLTPDRPDLKRKIGYLPQNPVLPKWVTGREILDYAAALQALPKADQRVEQSEAYWDCASYNKKPLATLSYGMQKRVGLALATLADPDLLILDEPHSGLDLFHVKALDDEILRRAKAGKATVLSTHVTAFAAAVADRVHVIAGGNLAPLEGWETRTFLDRIALIESTFFHPGSQR